MTGDYLLLARTKGLTKSQAITRHAMRNAMVPILPMILGGFIDYAMPLIQEETPMKKKNGLPDFAKLKKVLA